MMSLNRMKTLLAASVLVTAGWAGAASAVIYTSCVGTGYDLNVHVPDATDCEISDANNDFLNTNPPVVNQDGGFFDIDTWAFEGKLDDNGTLDGAEAEQGQAGSYDLTSYFDGLVGDVLLVFKDGVGSLVGYQRSEERRVGKECVP